MIPRHLLLATDGSEPSLEAARTVRDLLNPSALASVTVVAVVTPINAMPFYSYGGFGGYASQDIWDGVTSAAEKTAHDAMEQTAQELGSMAPVECVILHGSPADEIVRYAREHGAGLIVMGAAAGERCTRFCWAVCRNACCILPRVRY